MKIDFFEIRRQVLHILIGILFIFILLFVADAQMFLFIILIIGGLLSFLSTQIDVPIITRFLCVFERDCNKNFPGKGVLFFFIGSLLSLRLFSPKIAVASIIILTFADPISHFVGQTFGKMRIVNNQKNIEGTIAGVIVSTIIAGFIVNPLVAFLGSLAAMFLELAEIAMAGKTIDDNLLIPLVSGTIMHLLSNILII